jgi:hypothetical protein
LRDVVVNAVTVVFTDGSQAREALPLDRAVETVIADGSVAPVAAAAWLDDLKARDAAGYFFTAMTGFIVSGRKPA